MDDSLQSMAKLNTEALSSRELCITIYHAPNKLEDVVLSKEVKSLCLDALRSSEVKDLNKEINDISDMIAMNVVKQKKIKPGLAIFFKFNPLNFKKNKAELNEHNLNIFFSDYAPQTKIYAGEIFDLSTFSKMSGSLESLVVNISYNNFQVYSFYDGEITLQKDVQNVIEEGFEDRYTNVQRTAPGMGSGGVQSSSEKEQEKRAKFSRKIVNDVIEEVKKLPATKHHYRQILVLASADFVDDRAHIVDLLKGYSEFEPQVLNENIDHGKDLLPKVSALIKNAEGEYIDSEISESKTRVTKVLKQDFGDVVEEVRNANVYKLLLKEGLEQPGYLLDKELPYSDKYDGSREVLDLIPWIVQRVLSVDATIELLDKEDSRIDKIALIPRY